MTIGLAMRFHEASQGPAYHWWALAAVECGNFVVCEGVRSHQREGDRQIVVSSRHLTQDKT